MQRHLAIYLRDHEAAGWAGYDLLRRALANQRAHPYAAELQELATEAGEDLEALRRLMQQLGVRSNPALVATLRVGERLGRLKPNGSLLRRSPLSDLVEIEGLLAVTHVKAAGWEALAAADPETTGSPVDLAGLLERAHRQVERLAAIHRSVAVAVFAGDELPRR